MPKPSMPHLALIACASFLAFAPPAVAQTGEVARVAGDWQTPDGSAVVRIEPCKGATWTLCGRVISVSDPDAVRHDAVGKLMLRDFAWRQGAWRGGTVRDLKTGRRHYGAIKLGAGSSSLCRAGACSTEAWRRVPAEPS